VDKLQLCGAVDSYLARHVPAAKAEQVRLGVLVSGFTGTVMLQR
jgi:hypothetical protein